MELQGIFCLLSSPAASQSRDHPSCSVPVGAGARRGRGVQQEASGALAPSSQLLLLLTELQARRLSREAPLSSRSPPCGNYLPTPGGAGRPGRAGGGESRLGPPRGLCTEHARFSFLPGARGGGAQGPWGRGPVLTPRHLRLTLVSGTDVPAEEPGLRVLTVVTVSVAEGRVV